MRKTSLWAYSIGLMTVVFADRCVTGYAAEISLIGVASHDGMPESPS